MNNETLARITLGIALLKFINLNQVREPKPGNPGSAIMLVSPDMMRDLLGGREPHSARLTYCGFRIIEDVNMPEGSCGAAWLH